MAQFLKAWATYCDAHKLDSGSLAKLLGFGSSADLFLLRRQGPKRAVKTVYADALAAILGDQILEVNQ